LGGQALVTPEIVCPFGAARGVWPVSPETNYSPQAAAS
jgi:hypothetical protein